MAEGRNIYAIRIVAALLLVVNSIWLFCGGNILNGPLILPFVSLCGNIGIACILITVGFDVKKNALPGILIIVSMIVRNSMLVRWRILYDSGIIDLVFLMTVSLLAGVLLRRAVDSDSMSEDSNHMGSKPAMAIVAVGIVVLYLSTLRYYNARSFDTYGIMRYVFYVYVPLLIALLMYAWNAITVKENAITRAVEWLSESAYAVTISYWFVVRFILRISFLNGLFQKWIVRFSFLIVASIIIGCGLHMCRRLFDKADRVKKGIAIGVMSLVCISMLVYKVITINRFHVDQLEEVGYRIENVHVTVGGLDRPYHFLWISDLHIAISDDEVAEAEMANVSGRENSLFTNDGGTKSSVVWSTEMARLLDESNADGVFLGGDLVDFSSEANINCLKNGLANMKTPYLYLRADYDNYVSWLTPDAQEKCKDLQNTVCENEDVMYSEYEKFIVLAFNNSTSQLSENGARIVNSVFEKNKPVILLTHVPLQSKVDESLSVLSKQTWQNRELTWGDNTSYIPDKNTKTLLEKVYNSDSSVKEVLAGHLHFTWDGNISESVHQHVFSPAYSGTIGVITVE